MTEKQWLELIDENRKDILQVMQEAQFKASTRGECGYKELVILHDDGWVEEYMATGHECFDAVDDRMVLATYPGWDMDDLITQSERNECVLDALSPSERASFAAYLMEKCDVDVDASVDEDATVDEDDCIDYMNELWDWNADVADTQDQAIRNSMIDTALGGSWYPEEDLREVEESLEP